MSKSSSHSPYRRVLLKLSGEALVHNSGSARRPRKNSASYGISPEALLRICREIQKAYQTGTEIAIVVGGGNIWRGMGPNAQGIDRVTADNMGMLATIINALALQDGLERLGIPTRVQTSIEITKLAEPFIRRRAIRHLEKKRVVLFAGGTGSPYFTTDTTAALRAVEINAQILLKATKVHGVYTDDPQKNPKARLLHKLSLMQAIQKRLRIMDTSALSLCMDNQLPVLVFQLNTPGNIAKAVAGQSIGTLLLPHS
ncbi:MAG: UMP kinase [Elusimicrobia bacterium]|nr:UMP kinase [Elusimicrobiota bacterium]